MTTAAAKKAVKTRQANEKKMNPKTLAKKRSNAAKKAWKTRRENDK